MSKSHVTTGQGDAGTTRALNGRTYPKDHVLMEAVGALDDLRARTALLKIHIATSHPTQGEFLEWLMNAYFSIGTALSDPEKQKPEYWQVTLNTSHLAKLEAEQSTLEPHIDWAKSFVVGAATEQGAHADLAATAARQLERRIVSVKGEIPTFDDSVITPFINRLSDYLFVLARYLDGGSYIAVDYERLKD